MTDQRTPREGRNHGMTDKFVEELLLTFARAQKAARAEGYAAGYAAGQREMRHRAMDVINHNPDAAGSRYIYDLPIIEEPKEKDK